MIRYSALPTGQDLETRSDGSKIWARNLVAFYETDPEAVASVLPRPLEPTEPHVRINLAQVDMPDGDHLGAGTFSVKCRHGELEGTYDLLMIMTIESAVLGGRETFGEPKKLGRASLSHEGGEVVGSMGREGVDLVEVGGKVVEELPAQALSERYAFYYKFLLDPQGGRFDSDPELVHVRRTQEDRLRERVEGQVILRDSAVDPLADLAVLDVVSITYTESHQTQTGTLVQSVPGEWVWPFRHQRYDSLMARSRPT